MTGLSSRARRGGRRFALACGVLALGAACQRKAPGPEECRDFALRVTGVQSELDLQNPVALDRVNDVTTKCLVTPYDRELVACIEHGLGTRACMSAFAARHAALTNVGPAPPQLHRRDLPFP